MRRNITVLVLLFAVSFSLQWRNGAFDGEYGASEPDEAAHFLNGLMIHDWVKAGLPAPLEYAKNYYAHYPKISIGWWPPLFHSVEAGWMLLFSPSRTSACALMALISALLGLVVFHYCRRKFSMAAGIAGGLAVVLDPGVQRSTATVMLETSVALACTLAVVAMARFVKTGKRSDLLMTAAFVAMGLLIKGSAATLALALVLLPVLARRARVLLRPDFWVAMGAAALVAAPWQYLAFRFYSTEPVHIGRKAITSALVFYPMIVASWVGPILAALAVIGCLKYLVIPHFQRNVEPLWAAVGALIIGSFVFHCFMPWIDARHMTMLIPAVIMFTVAGAHSAAGFLTAPESPRWHRLAVGLLAAGTLLPAFTVRIPRRPSLGFDQAANLVTRPEFQNSVILVSSGGKGEGPFVTEVAIREHRPGHVVLRARKVLGSSTWNGKFYRVRYQTPEAMSAYLESVPVDVIVVDGGASPSPVAHHKMLLELLKSRPDQWRLIATYSSPGAPGIHGSEIRVYRRLGKPATGRRRISIPMEYTLGKPITVVVGPSQQASPGRRPH